MRFVPLALVAALALLVLAAPAASAHKTTYTPDGKVKIVWGFLNEPAVTMTKTGLDLHLYDNLTGVPLEGVEKTLNASLVLGDQVHAFDNFRAQHGQKGRYTDVITMTRPGLYSLRLEGAINGTSVQMDIPGAHEITPISDTYFPALADDSEKVKALEAKVAQLEAKLAALEGTLKTRSETPATVVDAEGANSVPGFGAATLALAAVAAVLALRRRG